jgi:hypothetical protein
MLKNSRHTLATIEKIKNAGLGERNSQFGKKRSRKARQLTSRAIRRCWKSAAFRKRWREARWGRIRENENVNPRNSA